MKIKKLDPSFYSENKTLIEALDLVDGEWTPSKQRGHGVVKITFKNSTFAIPLRSNIRHSSACFTTDRKGLDFSKALLIEKMTYISNEDFKIDHQSFIALQKKERTLSKRFAKYVNRYIKAIMKNDRNILNSLKYRYTTLKNYHEYLLSD